MEIIIMQNTETRAEILRPMYDEYPDLGSYPSVMDWLFEKGDIIKVDRDFVPAPITTSDGEVLRFADPLPKGAAIILTRRNRKLAYLFSKKMEESRDLEEVLMDADYRGEVASREIPNASSVEEIVYHSRIQTRNQEDAMKCLLLMDSILAQAARYGKMLQK